MPVLILCLNILESATKRTKNKTNRIMETPVCVGQHDFDSDEFDYTSEEIEVSDDEVPPTPRVKRSDDDDVETNKASVRAKRDYDDDYDFDSDKDNQYSKNDLHDWGYDAEIQNDEAITPYSRSRSRHSSDFHRFHESRYDEDSDSDSGYRYDRNRSHSVNVHLHERNESNRIDEHRRRRRHRITTSRVRMPTSKKRDVTITIPNMRGWQCGKDKTKLIKLDPNGKMGGKEYKIVVEQMEKTKADHPSGKFQSYNIIKVEKVVNGCFWSKYKKRQAVVASEAHYRNERILFHGSSKVKELLEFGFDERYANINGMFGAGIYFAKHSSKSNQYAFGMMAPCPTHKDLNCDICERQIIMCRVTLGKMKEEKGAKKRPHAPPGYHSVVGVASPGGLKYNEYIVYRGEQVYAEYLVTYKIVK